MDATPTYATLLKRPRTRTVTTREATDLVITIFADPTTNTIYATPDNGNIFLAIPGDTVTWKCDQAFSLQFLDLTGTGAELTAKGEAGAKTFRVKLEQECTFFKYIITVGNQVLDPYIGTDH